MSFLNELQNNLFASNSGNVSDGAIIKLTADDTSLKLPVMPEKFEVQVSQNNSTININSFGELNMKGKTGLRSITIESFFPAQAYSFCLCTPESPYSYVETIDGWRKDGKIVKLMISDTIIDMSCLIEGFSYSEQDGSNDVYFSISLKEYKDIANLDKASVDKGTGLNNRKVDVKKKADTTIMSNTSIMTAISKTARNAMMSGGSLKGSVNSLYKNMIKSGAKLNKGSVLTVQNGKVTIKNV